MRGGATTTMQALPLIAELEAALASASDTRRIAMLTRITDLLVSGAHYSPKQIGVFDDVMARLVATVDAEARATLARRLAPIANAPSSLIHMLAFDDEIKVARPILSQSERLADFALCANAATKSQQHLLAIAQRRSLSEAVTDVLIERGEREVLRAVVNNVGSRFSDVGCRRLIERSAGDNELTIAIGLRRDIAAVQAGAQSRNRVGRSGEAELYRHARDRNFEETALTLSMLCDAPLDLVERALSDPTAEIILILAKVAGLSSVTTKAMLLLRAADRGMSATDVDHALSSFERLQATTARRVLEFFRSRLRKPATPPVSPAKAVSF